MDLQGLTVVVTGASRGLGRALAIEFVKAGSNVVGLARDAAGLDAIASQIQSESFLPLTCDVGNPKEVESAMQKVFSVHGRIDVLFNNAALYPRVSFLEESYEEWATAIDANINGIAYCCKAVLPFMIASEKGRIYNLGSWAYTGPIERSAAYSTSKGAVHTLTTAIAADVEPLGLDIQVHEWIPGHLNTRMSEFTGIDPSISAKWAVAMVSDDSATKTNSIFENNYEWIPPKRMKERLIDLLLFRS